MKSSRQRLPLRPRQPRDAVFEALPELLACLSCVVALADPDWPGFDLLLTAGLLFFVEFPLALITLFAGVLRLGDNAMDRGTKRAFVLAPALVFGGLAFVVLGPPGLTAVLWLSAGNIYRHVSGAPPSSRAVPGFFMTYTTGDDEAPIGRDTGMSMRVKSGAVRTWRVQGGVEQLEAATTLMLWVVVALGLLFLELPPGNVTAEYAQAVGWPLTAIGAAVPPSSALWAGALLFGMRTLGKLDFGTTPTDAPPVDIEDDPVLREIARKLDGNAKPRGKKRRR